MNVHEAPQLSGKTRRRQTRKGFVHVRHGTQLFFRKFVGALKIVNLDFTRIADRLKIVGVGIARTYRGEQLIYFIL